MLIFMLICPGAGLGFLFAAVKMSEASISSSVLTLVPTLELGLPKALLLREKWCLCIGFGCKPLLLLCNSINVVARGGGGREFLAS